MKVNMVYTDYMMLRRNNQMPIRYYRLFKMINKKKKKRKGKKKIKIDKS